MRAGPLRPRFRLKTDFENQGERKSRLDRLFWFRIHKDRKTGRAANACKSGPHPERNQRKTFFLAKILEKTLLCCKLVIEKAQNVLIPGLGARNINKNFI